MNTAHGLERRVERVLSLDQVLRHLSVVRSSSARQKSWERSVAEYRPANRFGPYPTPGRISDKRTKEGSKRYLRAITHHNLMLAACGCTGITIGINGICTCCQGAVLTPEERNK